MVHVRFLPVKKTSDLLLVMSNIYTMNQGSLAMSPKVGRKLYKIQSVSKHLGKQKEVNQFEFRTYTTVLHISLRIPIVIDDVF